MFYNLNVCVSLTNVRLVHYNVLRMVIIGHNCYRNKREGVAQYDQFYL